MKIIITEEEIKDNSNNSALGELVRSKYWTQLKGQGSIENKDDELYLKVNEDGRVVSIIKPNDIKE